MKGRKTARAHPIPKSSGLKQLARGVATKNLQLLADRQSVTPKSAKSAVNLSKGHPKRDDHFVCKEDKFDFAAVFDRGTRRFFVGSSHRRTQKSCSNSTHHPKGVC